MKRIAFAVALLLAAATAGAQVYEWKDAKGKTHFSDKPPPGSVRAQQIGDSPAAAGPAQATTAERELDYRKRQKEAQDKAEKDKKDQAANADKQEACAAARRQLETLESGERVALRNEQGERYYLDDAQREQESAKARQIIQSACKP